MPQLETPRYDLYGLPCSPYAVRPLDPLQRGTDEDLLLELEGFIELHNIEDALQAAATSHKPAFFLIIGTGNSGRTSLANYMMYRYRELRAQQPGQEELRDRFVAYRPERQELNFAHEELLRDTLLWLRNEGDDPLNIEFSDQGLESQLAKLSDGEISNIYDLQLIATRIGKAFSGKPAGFGIHYDGMKSKEMLSWVPKVFQKVQTVVVLTVDDYSHGATAQLSTADRGQFRQLGGAVIELSHLTARQIAMLAEARWNGTPPSPFDRDGITAAFKEARYAVGNALMFLDGLLWMRLHDYSDAAPWTGSEETLKLDKSWLAGAIAAADFWMDMSRKYWERHDG
jgi:hypothetical protein